MDPVITTKRKQPCSTITDYSRCLICQSTTDELGRMCKLTSRGFNTFKDAVETRRDHVYYRLWNDLQNADEFLRRQPMCHVNCRSDYTHKKNVQAKRLKTENEMTGETSSTSGRTSRTGIIDYKLVCFLCEKERDGKGDRLLTAVASYERQASIHKKAKELNDETVLLKIQGHGDTCLDLIANDFSYHLRCMNRFMAARGKPNTDSGSSAVMTEYDSAFLALVSEISHGLLNDKHAYSIDQILKRYNELLSQYDIATKSGYRKDRLIKRLTKHFGSSIQFVSLKGASCLMCPSSLTVKELCDQVVGLKSELEEYQVYSDDDVDDDPNPMKNVDISSYPLAKHLRTEVKAAAKRMHIDVDNEFSISYDTASRQIPVELYNHLAWLITESDENKGDSEKVHLSENDKETVLNLSQDIINYICKQPTPKQVGLAMHVLKETHSKNIVTMLNRFGNSISYASAQRYLTTIASEVTEQERKEGIFIPSNIIHRHFAQYAFDNLNFHSETDDGSLDATTNIIYQYTKQENIIGAGKVPLHKTRQLTVNKPEAFVPVSSNLTLKDRKEARSLCGIELISDATVASNTLIDATVASNTLIDATVASNTLIDENIVWFLLRMFPTQMMTCRNDSTSCTPTWNTFFEVYDGQQAHKTSIGYGPLYPQTPTNPDVVQTSLDYFISLNLKLGQSKTVITCDQAIYDIVKGLLNKNPLKYKDVIVRLGGFHIAMNFMGSIGFFMRESGIEDILAVSNICGRGTANKVMAGKDYYKMVRYHSLLCEAFFMLKWEAFEQWLLHNDEAEALGFLSSLLEKLRTAYETKDTERIVVFVGDVMKQLGLLESQWKDFENTLGVTAQLWGMYIDMVLILKRYIHAERAGIWKQHLLEVQNMLPYTVSSGHTKYMSCLPIYLNEMKNLPNTAPEIQREFEAGNFTVHQTEGVFNGVWTDLALEQTYNNEGKTRLFKGITHAEAAREKYIKTLPFLTSVSENVKKMVHMESPHPDHHEKRSKDDIERVLEIRNTVAETMRNPFVATLGTDKLINIATGETLESTQLVKARTIGLESIRDASTTNAAKIVTPKIMTFASQQKQGKGKRHCMKKLINVENTVTRALCFTQELSDEAKIEAFSYEWNDYPPSLFEPNSTASEGYTMRKGTKYDFIETLQKEVADSWKPMTEISQSDSESVYVIDAMAFIQRYRTLASESFGQLQERYLQKILAMKPIGCSEVHFVGDRYDFGEMSLKDGERQRRVKGVLTPEYIPDHNMKIPEWKGFLSNPQNKANLLSYISSSWTQPSSVPDGITLIIGVGTKGIRVTSCGTTVLQELCCHNHEEADTRIFSHIASCQKSSVFIVHAADTDIIMLSMYHYPRLPHVAKLWVEKNYIFFPIHDLVDKLASTVEKDALELTDTLLISYVLSGCDSVSFPFGRGKKRAAKVAMQHIGKMTMLTSFSHTNVGLSDKLFDEARDFWCDLYGKPGYSSLDRLRAHIFASSKQDLRSLPPTEDSFHFHVLRSLCQISLYKQANVCNPTLLAPEQYGRYLDSNGRLFPVMKRKVSKPATAKLTFCKCRKGCIKNCPCAKARLECIIACTCNGTSPKCGRLTEDNGDSD